VKGCVNACVHGGFASLAMKCEVDGQLDSPWRRSDGPPWLFAEDSYGCVDMSVPRRRWEGVSECLKDG
jgi:hypothetical protein